MEATKVLVICILISSLPQDTQNIDRRWSSYFTAVRDTVPAVVDLIRLNKRCADFRKTVHEPNKRRLDIETHGWIDEEHSVGRWTGQFGKSAWRSQRQLEFSRVVQLGIVAFDASGRMIARRELCVSDAPPCQTQAVFYHHLSEQMLRATGAPPAPKRVARS